VTWRGSSNVASDVSDWSSEITYSHSVAFQLSACRKAIKTVVMAAVVYDDLERQRTLRACVFNDDKQFCSFVFRRTTYLTCRGSSLSVQYPRRGSAALCRSQLRFHSITFCSTSVGRTGCFCRFLERNKQRCTYSTGHIIGFLCSRGVMESQNVLKIRHFWLLPSIHSLNHL